MPTYPWEDESRYSYSPNQYQAYLPQPDYNQGISDYGYGGGRSAPDTDSDAGPAFNTLYNLGKGAWDVAGKVLSPLGWGLEYISNPLYHAASKAAVGLGALDPQEAIRDEEGIPEYFKRRYLPESQGGQGVGTARLPVSEPTKTFLAGLVGAGAGMAADPFLHGMGAAAKATRTAVEGAGTAASVLGKSGVLADAGIEAYAPQLAEWARGAERGLPAALESAERTNRLMKPIHYGFQTTMAMGAAEGGKEMWEGATSPTPDWNRVAAGAASALVAGGGLAYPAYLRGRQARAEVRAFDQGRKARLRSTPMETDAPPTFNIPEGPLRDEASDLAARPDFSQDMIPDHLREHAAHIQSEADYNRASISEGNGFLERMRRVYGDRGAVGITREGTGGPDSPNYFLVQRARDPATGKIKVVGAAQIDGGGLTFITGGRAMKSPVSVGPLQEAVDALGVERTGPQSPLEHRARRRAMQRMGGMEPLPEPESQMPESPVEAEPESPLSDLVGVHAQVGPGRTEIGQSGFYSQLRAIVDSPKTQGAQRGSDWLKFLADPKREIKQQELRDSGLDQFLRDRGGQRVERAEIQKYLDEEAPKVYDEHTRGSRNPSPYEQRGKDLVSNYSSWSDRLGAAIREVAGRNSRNLTTDVNDPTIREGVNRLTPGLAEGWERARDEMEDFVKQHGEEAFNTALPTPKWGPQQHSAYNLRGPGIQDTYQERVIQSPMIPPRVDPALKAQHEALDTEFNTQIDRLHEMRKALYEGGGPDYETTRQAVMQWPEYKEAQARLEGDRNEWQAIVDKYEIPVAEKMGLQELKKKADADLMGGNADSDEFHRWRSTMDNSFAQGGTRNFEHYYDWRDAKQGVRNMIYNVRPATILDEKISALKNEHHEKKQALQPLPDVQDPYTSGSHWGDLKHPNVHYRAREFFTPSESGPSEFQGRKGEREFLGDEFQADRSNQLQHEKAELKKAQAKLAEIEATAAAGGGRGNPEYQQDLIKEGTRRIAELESVMPFSGEETPLIVKRFLKEAAERGVDRVSWTTGDTQVERWVSAVADRVDTIKADRVGNGMVKLRGEMNGSKVVEQEIPEKELWQYVGQKASETITKQLDDYAAEQRRLAEMPKTPEPEKPAEPKKARKPAVRKVRLAQDVTIRPNEGTELAIPAYDTGTPGLVVAQRFRPARGGQERGVHANQWTVIHAPSGLAAAIERWDQPALSFADAMEIAKKLGAVEGVDWTSPSSEALATQPGWGSLKDAVKQAWDDRRDRIADEKALRAGQPRPAPKPKPKTQATLSASDLSVGGTGRREYYDKILPSEFQKWGKKFGLGEVETHEMATGRMTRKGGEARPYYRAVGPRGEVLSDWFPRRETLDAHWGGRVDRGELESYTIETKDAVPETPETITVHSMRMPPEAREKIKREGFPLYQVEKPAQATPAEDRPIPRSTLTPEARTAQTRDLLVRLYPDNTYIREHTDGSFVIDLPKDPATPNAPQRTVIFRPGVDHISITVEDVKAGHGERAAQSEVPVGVTYTMDNAAIVHILDAIDPLATRTAIHEHWHVLRHLGNLTPEQVKVLERAYPETTEGKTSEERQADAFADWVMSRRPKNTVFTRILDALKALHSWVVGQEGPSPQEREARTIFESSLKEGFTGQEVSSATREPRAYANANDTRGAAATTPGRGTAAPRFQPPAPAALPNRQPDDNVTANQQRINLGYHLAASRHPEGKRRAGAGYAQAPKTSNTLKLTREGKPFIIGPITQDEWLQKARAWVGEPGSLDWVKARNWYSDLLGEFNKVYGEGDGERMLNLWGMTQQNASPSAGFANLLRAEDVVRGFRSERAKKAGLSHDRLIAAMRGEDHSLGQKLADFADAIKGKSTRQWVGHDPRGGSPAPVDVHAARDIGFVDEITINRVRKLFGRNTAKRLTPDLRVMSDGQYFTGHEYYNKLADYLNERGVDGGNWTPAEVQAVGWTAQQRMMGQSPQDVSHIFPKSIAHVTVGGSPAPGSPRESQWLKIPETQRAAVALNHISDVAPGAAELAGVRILGETAAYHKSPVIAFETLNPDAAHRFSRIMARATHQSDNVTSRTSPKSRANAIGLDVQAPEGFDFTNREDVTRFWSESLGKEDGLDTTMLVGDDGTPVLRVIAKSKSDAARALQALNTWAGDRVLSVEQQPVEVLRTKADWRKDNAGEAHTKGLRGVEAGTLDAFLRGAEDSFQRRVQEARAAGAGAGAATHEPEAPIGRKAQISPAQARGIKMETKLPDDEAFRAAVHGTPAAEIAPDGLLINVVRFQQPEQAGEQSIRTGVFYLPEGAAQARHYRRAGTTYGGQVEVGGQTLLRRPLFVKGATGGKAPQVAYDQINGKGAYERMRTDVLQTTNRGLYGQRRTGADIQGVAEVLQKYGADPGVAHEIVANSRQGNQLPYAVQENIVAHAVRKAGYDSVLGWSKGKSGPFLSELFDVREATYPVPGREGGDLHPMFEEGEFPVAKASTIPVPGPGGQPTTPGQAPAPTPPPLATGQATGNPPRVEERVSNLYTALAEQRRLGIPAKDIILSRDTRRSWSSLDPEIREHLRDWDDDKMLGIMKRRNLDDAESQAMDAVIRGRREASNDARLDYLNAKHNGSAAEIAETFDAYAKSLSKYMALDRGYIKDGTGLGRALAARARIMASQLTPDRKMLRQIMKEFKGISDADADRLVLLWESGDPHFADALRAHMVGRAHKFWTLYRANLLSIPSEFANVAGNTITQGVELGDKLAAAGVDKALSLLTGKRERFAGEVGVEMQAMMKALPASLVQFANERLIQIPKRAWTGESREVKVGTPLQHQVQPFKSKFFRFLASPLDALGASDDAAQAVIRPGVIASRAYRMAVERVGKTRGAQVMAEAQRLVQDIVDFPEKHGDTWNSINSEVARRVFREKPAKIISSIENVVKDHPWLNVILPFIKTPGNITRYAVRHSPLALREIYKAQKAYRAGEISQGELADVIAPRITGLLVTGMVYGLAQAGWITGAGPSETERRKALLASGWQPYSMVIRGADGRNYYLPYSRFDPIAQLVGTVADAHELKDTKSATEAFDKIFGSIMSNLSNRVFLRGLMDFGNTLADPKRYLSTWASNVAQAAVPGTVDKLAYALDPVYRDVRPEDKGLTGIPMRVLNTWKSQLPGVSKWLPSRNEVTGKPAIRPGGEGFLGSAARFISPVLPSVQTPGTELEQIMGRVGGTGESHPYLTIQGHQVVLQPAEREVMRQADLKAASELRRAVSSYRFTALPDTEDEGGNESKEHFIRTVFNKHRNEARQRLLRSASFRRRALDQIRNSESKARFAAQTQT